MGSELGNGAETKNIEGDHNQIVFGDALSALSYNDWLAERAFKEASLVPTREYWDKMCPCKIHYDDNMPISEPAMNSFTSQLAHDVMPTTTVNRPVSVSSF